MVIFIYKISLSDGDLYIQDKFGCLVGIFIYKISLSGGDLYI